MLLLAKNGSFSGINWVVVINADEGQCLVRR